MLIFQPAMLVYQRVGLPNCSGKLCPPHPPSVLKAQNPAPLPPPSSAPKKSQERTAHRPSLNQGFPKSGGKIPMKNVKIQGETGWKMVDVDESKILGEIIHEFIRELQSQGR